MSDCGICREKQRTLKEAVSGHWHAVRQFRAALEASEDLSTLDVTMRETQVRMNRAEDSYRQHIRLMHETTVGTRTSPRSSFTRFSSRSRSEVMGN